MILELDMYKENSKGLVMGDEHDMDEYTCKLLKFWERRRLSLPHFAKAAAIAFSMTPSSASVERIFSLYKSMFGTEQLHALRDYIQSAMMLNFNERDI